MLRLLLLRHAKAVHDAATDAERPLAPEGIADSARLGAMLAASDYVPARILSSPSRRTRETLLGLLPPLLWQLPPKASMEFCPGLYNGGERAYLELVRAQPAGASPLLLIGHNPTIQEFAGHLAGSGPLSLRRAMASKFPTAAVAVLDFDIERWADVANGTGELTAFIAPKD